MKHTTAQFDFEAKPKVTAVKPKYRERDDRLDGTNLMNDPRIVRGNTYSAIVENKNQVQPPPRKELKQNKLQKKERRINFDTGFQIATPRAVQNREHFSIQTEPFVETLRDKAINYERECQTDLFLDRPVEREFNPLKGKTGVDRNTQIQENEPQLFDFNQEVQPIIDALMSKVLQTSRMELFQEKQLHQKQAEKQDYERRRHARLAEAQKLEATELRLDEESERRQHQYKKYSESQKYSEKKVIARILSKQYLQNMKSNTYRVLQTEGFFRQPLETTLLSQFTPWLYEEIQRELYSLKHYRQQTDKIIHEAETELLRASEEAMKREIDRRTVIKREKEEAIRQRREKKEEKKRLAEEETEKARQAIAEQLAVPQP